MSDIIDFYNSIFVTKMQAHLLKFCTPEASEKSGDDRCSIPSAKE